MIPVRDLFVSFLFNRGEHLLSITFAFSADRTFMFGSDAVSFQGSDSFRWLGFGMVGFKDAELLVSFHLVFFIFTKLVYVDLLLILCNQFQFGDFSFVCFCFQAMLIIHTIRERE